MSALKAKIQSSLVTAMKARDAARVQALRGVTAAVKKKEVDERRELTDADLEKIIRTMEKQIKETLEQAKAGGRQETVTECDYELAVLKEFMPEQLSEADVEKLVRETHAKVKDKLPAGGAGMGMLMKEVMAVVGGRSDGKIIQAAVKKVLG